MQQNAVKCFMIPLPRFSYNTDLLTLNEKSKSIQMEITTYVYKIATVILTHIVSVGRTATS